MLLEEFFKPLGISQSELAIRLGVSYPRLNDIVRRGRSVTPDTALRLAIPPKCRNPSLKLHVKRTIWEDMGNTPKRMKNPKAC